MEGEGLKMDRLDISFFIALNTPFDTLRNLNEEYIA